MTDKPLVFNYEDFLAALEDLRRADITCSFCRHRADCSNGGSLECFDCLDDACHCMDCKDNSKWEWRGRCKDAKHLVEQVQVRTWILEMAEKEGKHERE